MSGGQFTSALVESVRMLRLSDFAGESESFQGQLVAAGFVPTPICVIDTADGGEHYAEVYEEAALRPGVPVRFLVRLLIRDQCEHLFTLADLPDLLEHFDRLTPLLTHTVESQGRQTRAHRALAAAAPRASRSQRGHPTMAREG